MSVIASALLLASLAAAVSVAGVDVNVMSRTGVTAVRISPDRQPQSTDLVLLDIDDDAASRSDPVLRAHLVGVAEGHRVGQRRQQGLQALQLCGRQPELCGELHESRLRKRLGQSLQDLRVDDLGRLRRGGIGVDADTAAVCRSRVPQGRCLVSVGNPAGVVALLGVDRPVEGPVRFAR